MNVLNEQQCRRATEAMNEYLAAPPGSEGKTPVEMNVELDRKRVKMIESELKPLLAHEVVGKERFQLTFNHFDAFSIKLDVHFYRRFPLRSRRRSEILIHGLRGSSALLFIQNIHGLCVLHSLSAFPNV